MKKMCLKRFGQDGRNLGRELGRRHRRRLEEGVVVGQVEHLAIGGLGQLLAAIADIHAPQARHAVEQLVALGVPDPHAVGMGDDPRAAVGMEGLVVGEGMEMVADVVLDEFGDIEVLLMGGHGFSPNWIRTGQGRAQGGNDVLWLIADAGAVKHDLVMTVPSLTAGRPERVMRKHMVTLCS